MAPLPLGTFGENFTTSSRLETEVCIGDVFQTGSAIIQATAPLLPCFKFGHKIGRPDILKDFLHSGRCGFDFRALREGDVASGAPIEPTLKAPHGITIRRALGLQKLREGDADELGRALEIENLKPLPKREFAQRFAKSRVDPLSQAAAQRGSGKTPIIRTGLRPGSRRAPGFSPGI